MRGALWLLACLLSTTVQAETLTAHDWYPGFLPGLFGRTTLTLSLAGDNSATLDLETQRPPQTQRQRFNPSEWGADPTAAQHLVGSVKRERQGRMTVTFLRGETPPLVLTCSRATGAVHAAGATVTPPRTCSPCYDACKEQERWSPAATVQRAGLRCQTNDALGSPFFTSAGDVEFVRGATDCPPSGLRLTGAPHTTWDAFPEGVTALRDVKRNSRHTLVVRRHGATVELSVDGLTYVSRDVHGAASTADGAHRFAVSCWTEPATLHSRELSFQLPPGVEPDACDGLEELPKSRSARQVSALWCRVTRDDGTEDEPLPFVRGRIIERLDVETDCTHRRALRALTSLDDQPFP